MLGSMEALLGRSNDEVRDLDRSQKSRIFYESAEVELETSKMSPIPI